MRRKTKGFIELVVSVLLVFGGYSVMFSQLGLIPNKWILALGFVMVVTGAVLEFVGLSTMDL